MVKGVDSLGRVVMLMAMAALASWQNSASAQGPANVSCDANVHVLNKRVFQFPIRIDPAMQSRTRDVALFMRDGPAPAPWQLVATVAPTAPDIRCQVPHDGEFSFHVVTTDVQGRPSISLEDLEKFPPARTVLVTTVAQTPRGETVYPLVQSKIDADTQPPSGSPSGRPVFELPNYSVPAFPARPQDAMLPATTTTTTTYIPPMKASQTTSFYAPSTSASSPNQLFNTTRVGINYNVGKRGTSGVGKIDVWMTPDHGRSWQRIGEELNQRKPISAEFPGEGVFGIRLVATNGNGIGGKAPAAGDVPAMTFEIDLTEPKIHSLETEPIFQNGVIDIKWKVTDKNLGNEPIALYYAAQRTGPWLPIASKLKNDEVYRWALPKELPAEFYFRLEATDMAGNISRRDTQAPVLFDSTVPEIDVTGILPLQVRTGGK